MLLVLDNAFLQAFWDILKNTEFTYGTQIRTPPSLVGRQVSFKTPTLDAAVYELQLEDNQIGFAQVTYRRKILNGILISFNIHCRFSNMDQSSALLLQCNQYFIT